MDNSNSKPAISSSRQSSSVEDPKREKVDYEIREVIRAYPEDYPLILESLENWTKQFD
jgi:hypothetical protein